MSVALSGIVLALLVLSGYLLWNLARVSRELEVMDWRAELLELRVGSLEDRFELPPPSFEVPPPQATKEGA